MEINQKIKQKADEFVSFRLATDLSVLTENENQMLPILFQAAKIMDDIFWMEAYGNKEALFTDDIDAATEKFLNINYGPWERLNDDKPFIEGIGNKPAGANFYPGDMNKAEFEAWDNDTKTSLYTLIRRDENGDLKSIPYHIAFEDKVNKAAGLLQQAAFTE